MALIDMSETFQMTNPGEHIDATDIYNSNPNLLDNWYFVGGGSQLGDGIFPINQRGQTSYTGAAATGVDRWWQQYNTNVQLTSAGLRITGDWDIQQRFARPLPNGTYTLSVDVASKGDTTPLMMTINASYQQIGSSQITQNGINTMTFESTDSYPVQGVTVNLAAQAGADITIRAMKLEVGTVSTLANDAPPDFGAELAKCQRYLWVDTVDTNTVLADGIAFNAQGVFDYVTPVQMRKGTITATFTTTPYVTYGTGNLAQMSGASATISHNRGGNHLRFIVGLSADLGNLTEIHLLAGSTTTITFSNEL